MTFRHSGERLDFSRRKAPGILIERLESLFGQRNHIDAFGTEIRRLKWRAGAAHELLRAFAFFHFPYGFGKCFSDILGTPCGLAQNPERLRSERLLLLACIARRSQREIFIYIASSGAFHRPDLCAGRELLNIRSTACRTSLRQIFRTVASEPDLENVPVNAPKIEDFQANKKDDAREKRDRRSSRQE